MIYKRKDIVGQEEEYEGTVIEILFLVQVLEGKDYGIMWLDGEFIFDEDFCVDMSMEDSGEEDDEDGM